MKQNSPFFGCGAFIKKLKYYNVVCGMEKTKTKEIVLCNSCKSLDNKDSENSGCSKFIPVDPSDKNSEGWTCGQYYDAFKKKVFCDSCKKKEVKK